MNYVDQIIAFEQGELDENQIVELFAHLVRTGRAWTLQGAYGRMATALMNQGYLDEEGNILQYV
jgi:hypothetical protein